MADGRPIGGLLQKPIPAGEHRQSAWLTFIAVSDVDAAKRKNAPTVGLLNVMKIDREVGHVGNR